MKNKRLRVYLEQKALKKNNPITEKRDIQNHPDKHIDQDFEGYPHAPAKEELIKPVTKEQKKTASTGTKDGEKMIPAPKQQKDEEKKKEDEVDNGSASAFEQTESLTDDE